MSEEVRYRFKEAKKKPARTNVGPQLPIRLAMRLALAYYVERCIEDGTLESYADAARRLGITRARMTQLMDLMLMGVRGQNDVLHSHQEEQRLFHL